jgi:hypothetical protein
MLTGIRRSNLLHEVSELEKCFHILYPPLKQLKFSGLVFKSKELERFIVKIILVLKIALDYKTELLGIKHLYRTGSLADSNEVFYLSSRSFYILTPALVAENFSIGGSEELIILKTAFNTVSHTLSPYQTL